MTAAVDADDSLQGGGERRGSLGVPAAYPDGVKYQQEARSLWQTSVPPRGQAATVQGELLRAVEKLRDEAAGTATSTGAAGRRPSSHIFGRI